MPASIWLRLSGAADRQLRDAIARLAARHGTMPFQPHLTVCGIPPEDAAIAEAAADYVRRCGLLPLRVSKSGISCSTATPFKAVVIDIENMPALQVFRAGLQRVAGAAEPEPPHISLLYTIGEDRRPVAWAADEARLRAIAAEVAAAIAVGEFVLDCPAVVAPDGEWANIASWRVIRELSDRPLPAGGGEAAPRGRLD